MLRVQPPELYDFFVADLGTIYDGVIYDTRLYSTMNQRKDKRGKTNSEERQKQTIIGA